VGLYLYASRERNLKIKLFFSKKKKLSSHHKVNHVLTSTEQLKFTDKHGVFIKIFLSDLQDLFYFKSDEAALF